MQILDAVQTALMPFPCEAGVVLVIGDEGLRDRNGSLNRRSHDLRFFEPGPVRLTNKRAPNS